MSTKREKSRFSTLAKIVAATAVAAMLAASCGSNSGVGGSTEAASVGGVSLSRSDLESALRDLPDASSDGTVDAATTANYLSNWVFITALRQELADQGFDVTQANIDDATAQVGASADIDLNSSWAIIQIDQLAVQLAAEPYISSLAVDSSSAAVVPEYLCSSHILVDTVEEADVVVQRLADGEDFATLAAEVSTGPSGPNGGDLGCVDTATFVPEFIAGARTVAPSGITGPVQSQFGFHVINVRSMGPLSAENHPEMDQAAIDAALQQANSGSQSAGRDAAISAIIDDVNTRVLDTVSIDPRFGEWSAGAGVVPPSGVTSAG